MGALLDIKNNGRWKTLEELSKYHAQGSIDRMKAMEGNVIDGIWRMWVWKHVTLARVDGRDQM